MAILVTRPAPDNERTAATLRARGHDVLLAPMLRFEPVAFHLDPDRKLSALIVTSANALRALADHPEQTRLLTLPVFAVGERTAQAAREAGFADVTAAGGDASSLRELVLAQARARHLKKTQCLLYLAASDRARDLGDDLGARGFDVATVIAYRMAMIDDLPATASAAFAAGTIEAVLHYSARSARAFLAAIRLAGVEISALGLPHCCISEAVATVLRDGGATQVAVARVPDEDAMVEALARALPPGADT